MRLILTERIDTHSGERIVLDILERSLRCVCRTVTRRDNALHGSDIQTWRGDIIAANVTLETHFDEQCVICTAEVDCTTLGPSVREDVRLSINGVLNSVKNLDVMDWMNPV